MVPLSFHEASLASQNAMLSAKVSKALRKVSQEKALDELDRRVLRRGVDLLTLIIQGSALIERTQCPGLVPSAAGITALGRAMTALHVLKLAEIAHGLTEFFVSYRDNLAHLADGEAIGVQELDALRRFFTTIADLFQRDVRAAAIQPVPDVLITA